MMDVMGQVQAGGVVPQQFTGFLLRRAYVVSREHAQACVGEDSTVRDVPALTLIRDDGAISQRRLGELLNVNRTTTGKLVDALEAKGLIVRERDAHDRRSYALRLTDDGRQTLSVLHRSLERGEAHLTQPLTPAEHERLTTALQQLLADDATVSIEGLGNRCGYLIARAHRVMFDRATQALRPLGLTPRDFGVLSALAMAQPCSQQRLAAIMGISAPAVLAFVDELEAAGLVSRRRNQADRRAYDLTLTGKGTDVLAKARQAALEMQATIAQTLGTEPDQDLRSLLEKVIQVGPYAAEVGDPDADRTVGRPVVDVAQPRSS
jgi:DNA-binding MarR family transcriptional regulator